MDTVARRMSRLFSSSAPASASMQRGGAGSDAAVQNTGVREAEYTEQLAIQQEHLACCISTVPVVNKGGGGGGGGEDGSGGGGGTGEAANASRSREVNMTGVAAAARHSAVMWTASEPVSGWIQVWVKMGLYY